MKLTTRILSMVMAVCLLCSVCATALADDCFVLLYNFFTDTSGTYSVCPGKPDYEFDMGMDGFVMVIYNPDDMTAQICGAKANGEQVTVVWKDIGTAQGVSMIANVANVYGQVEGMLDPGSTLLLSILGNDDIGRDPISISSAEDAAQFMAVVDDLSL